MTTDYITTCERAARAGGDVLRQMFGKIRAQSKGHKDLVTEADYRSQAVIRDILLGEYPDHQFLGEESDIAEAAHNPGGKSDFRWVVDPLDGTINYVHGLPAFAVSVALERDGQTICGVVFDPVADECFAAKSGGGARLNGVTIRSSRCVVMEEALLAVSFGLRVDPDGAELRRFIRTLMASQAVRRIGAAALNLCYVAAGRLDGYYASSAKLWDVAAGILLVQEAGGSVSSLTGGPFELADPNLACAATPSLHAELLEILARAE